MALQFLNRNDAPFDTAVWNLIDEAVRSVAVGQLSARRILHTEGPYGLGFKSMPGPEVTIDEESADGLVFTTSKPVPFAMMQNTFTISAGDIQSYLQTGMSFNAEPIVSAALTLARKEDQFIFFGSKPAAITGLMNSAGVQSMKLKSWDQPGDAVESIIAGIDKLDKAGFHGPYSLALSPPLYHKLFRRYPQADLLEIEQVKQLVTDEIVKAPVLLSGGVLIASVKQYASIVLGEDLVTSFEGPEGRSYAFVLSESIALRLNVPASVCVLE